MTKQVLILSSVGLVVLGAAFAFGASRSHSGWCGSHSGSFTPAHWGKHHDGQYRLDIIAEVLDLDDVQKEKLQGVLETAGAVCHEMNQPLQTILGYTELALAAITPDNPAFSYWTRISQQIDRMAEITRKLQGITSYETMDYHGSTKIIDIHKASSI